MAQYKTKSDFYDTAWSGFTNSAKNSIGSLLGEKLRKRQADEELQNQIKLAEIKANLETKYKGRMMDESGQLVTDPLYQLKQQGDVADAEMKVYQAGGPAPSRFKGQPQTTGEQVSALKTWGQDVPQFAGQPISADYQTIPEKLDMYQRPTGYKVELKPEVALKQKMAEEDLKGLPIETGGKLAMVKQAKNDIAEVRQMIFPDGTPESFSRSRAFVSNLPGSRAPLIGAVIPQAMPFNEMGQKIYSRLQNAVAAKLRVETGAQANPSEVENILARFGITSASDPKSAFDSLQRLENFMDETINITDPRGRFSGKAQPNNAGVTSTGIKWSIE